jgi:hypothetical protein
LYGLVGFRRLQIKIKLRFQQYLPIGLCAGNDIHQHLTAAKQQYKSQLGGCTMCRKMPIEDSNFCCSSIFIGSHVAEA